MLHRPDSETVVPIVVVLRIDSATVEVQVPSVAGTVPRRRPVVAVRAAIVARGTIAVAGAGEECSPLCLIGLCTDGVGCRLHDCAAEHEEPPSFFSFSHLQRRQDGQPMNLSFP